MDQINGYNQQYIPSIGYPETVQARQAQGVTGASTHHPPPPDREKYAPSAEAKNLSPPPSSDSLSSFRTAWDPTMDRDGRHDAERDGHGRGNVDGVNGASRHRHHHGQVDGVSDADRRKHGHRHGRIDGVNGASRKTQI